jgi:hypothetical protein
VCLLLVAARLRSPVAVRWPVGPGSCEKTCLLSGLWFGLLVIGVVIQHAGAVCSAIVTHFPLRRALEVVVDASTLGVCSAVRVGPGVGFACFSCLCCLCCCCCLWLVF